MQKPDYGHFQVSIGGNYSVFFLKKWQKVDPHYFSILEGSSKSRNAKFDLRPLEWFFETMAKIRPPLFFNFKGGVLSSIFSKNHSEVPQIKFGILNFGLPKNAVF